MDYISWALNPRLTGCISKRGCYLLLFPAQLPVANIIALVFLLLFYFNLLCSCFFMFPKNQGKYYIKTTLGWYSIHYYDMEHQVLSRNHRVTPRVQQLLYGGYRGDVLLRPSASCCIDRNDMITVGILSWGLVRTMLFKLTEMIASAKSTGSHNPEWSFCDFMHTTTFNLPSSPVNDLNRFYTVDVKHMIRTPQALFPLHDISWVLTQLAFGTGYDFTFIVLYQLYFFGLYIFACNAPQQQGKFLLCENVKTEQRRLLAPTFTDTRYFLALMPSLCKLLIECRTEYYRRKFAVT